MDCFCENYHAGVEDQRNGRSASPYQLIHLRHGPCYRAGQIDERRRQLAEQRRNQFVSARRVRESRA